MLSGYDGRCVCNALCCQAMTLDACNALCCQTMTLDVCNALCCQTMTLAVRAMRYVVRL